MLRKPTRPKETFGQRLAKLRESAGYSQSELARELGISSRMMNYYEHGPEPPVMALLPPLSRALLVTTDQLLGIQPITRRSKPADGRLTRRLKQLEKLPAADRRQIVRMLDALIEREKLRQKIPA